MRSFILLSDLKGQNQVQQITKHKTPSCQMEDSQLPRDVHIYIFFLRFWYITNIFRNDNDWPSSLHHSTSSHVHLWKCIKSCPTRGDTESGMTAAGAQEATRPAITAFVSSGTRTTVDLVKIIENNMPCQNSGNVWKRHLIPHMN